jgi:hypothetical protein
MVGGVGIGLERKQRDCGRVVGNRLTLDIKIEEPTLKLLWRTRNNSVWTFF